MDVEPMGPPTAARRACNHAQRGHPRFRAVAPAYLKLPSGRSSANDHPTLNHGACGVKRTNVGCDITTPAESAQCRRSRRWVRVPFRRSRTTRSASTLLKRASLMRLRVGDTMRSTWHFAQLALVVNGHGSAGEQSSGSKQRGGVVPRTADSDTRVRTR